MHSHPPARQGRKTRSRHTRGFALIIVVICSVAVVAIAMALAFTSGANRIISVKGSSIERAETIAVTGMERAVAYAERVASVERDFDQLLDPKLNIDCAAPGAATGNGLPRFTDAGHVTRTVGGREYLAIPFNEGAYLVRFDDDNDDLIANSFFAPFANNHPQNNCGEGATAPGLNNPFRDRNRAVFISVIGIYPGTDPQHAPHQVSLRRYHVSTARLPTPAMLVRGDIELPKKLTFCSALGDVMAGGQIKLGEASPICGTPMSGGAVTATISSPGADCPIPTLCAPQGTPAAGTPFETSVLDSIPPPPSPAWMQPSTQCNLYALEKTGPFGGLFFWDAGAAPTCANPPATVLAPSLAGPSDVTDPDQCWRPLFLTTAAGVVNLLGWDDVVDGSGSGAGWKPRSGVVTPVKLTSDVDVDGKSFPANYNASKTTWDACAVQWKAVVSPRTCPACDGTKVVAGVNGNHVQLNFTEPKAVPAVTIRFAEFKTALNVIAAPAVPSTDDPDKWPLATIIADGKAEISDGTTASFGFSVSSGAPSLVVGTSLKLKPGATLSTAGSIIVNGDVLLEGDARLNVLGAVLVKGKLKADSAGVVTQRYHFDVFGSTNRPLIGVPTTSRGLR